MVALNGGEAWIARAYWVACQRQGQKIRGVADGDPFRGELAARLADEAKKSAHRLRVATAGR
jgi:hypothetical protein